MLVGLLLLAALGGLGRLATDTTINSLVCSQPPPVTITTPTDQSVTSDNPVTVSGSAEASASYTILVNGKSYTTGTVPISGYYSRAVNFPLGENQLQVKMTDSCGGKASSPVVSFVHILPPPVTSQTSQSSSSKTTNPLAGTNPSIESPQASTTASTSSPDKQPLLISNPANRTDQSPSAQPAKTSPTKNNKTKTAWITGAGIVVLASLALGAKWFWTASGFRWRKF